MFNINRNILTRKWRRYGSFLDDWLGMGKNMDNNFLFPVKKLSLLVSLESLLCTASENIWFLYTYISIKGIIIISIWLIQANNRQICKQVQNTRLINYYRHRIAILVHHTTETTNGPITLIHYTTTHTLDTEKVIGCLF